MKSMTYKIVVITGIFMLTGCLLSAIIKNGGLCNLKILPKFFSYKKSLKENEIKKSLYKFPNSRFVFKYESIYKYIRYYFCEFIARKGTQTLKLYKGL